MKNQPGCLTVSPEACLRIEAGALGLGATIDFSTRLGLAGEALSWKLPAFSARDWTYMFEITSRD